MVSTHFYFQSLLKEFDSLLVDWYFAVNGAWPRLGHGGVYWPLGEHGPPRRPLGPGFPLPAPLSWSLAGINTKRPSRSISRPGGLRPTFPLPGAPLLESCRYQYKTALREHFPPRRPPAHIPPSRRPSPGVLLVSIQNGPPGAFPAPAASGPHFPSRRPSPGVLLLSIQNGPPGAFPAPAASGPVVLPPAHARPQWWGGGDGGEGGGGERMEGKGGRGWVGMGWVVGGEGGWGWAWMGRGLLVMGARCCQHGRQ